MFCEKHAWSDACFRTPHSGHLQLEDYGVRRGGRESRMSPFQVLVEAARPGVGGSLSCRPGRKGPWARDSRGDRDLKGYWSSSLVAFRLASSDRPETVLTSPSPRLGSNLRQETQYLDPRPSRRLLLRPRLSCCCRRRSFPRAFRSCLFSSHAAPSAACLFPLASRFGLLNLNSDQMTAPTRTTKESRTPWPRLFGIFGGAVV